MNFRRVLSLFFGGLLFVVLGLVIAQNYLAMSSVLEKEYRKQLSPRSFTTLADIEMSLVLEKASTLSTNQDFTLARHEVQNYLEKLSDPPAALRALRTGKASDQKLSLVLNSLVDQISVVMARTDDLSDVEDEDGETGPLFFRRTSLNQSVHVEVESKTDLVLITCLKPKISQEEGVVLYEYTGDSGTGWVPSHASVKAPIAQDLDFLKGRSVLEPAGTSIGYLVYPDGHLYIYGARFLENPYEPEGEIWVGKRVDRDFLARLQDRNEVFVWTSEEIVGSSDGAKNLGTQLAKEVAITEKLGETWTSPDGRTFLLKTENLYSHNLGFRSDIEDIPPELVGKVVFLRDLEGVKTEVFRSSRWILLLGFGALVTSLILVSLVARRFTAPIEQLSEAMTAVGEGGLEQIEESEISSIQEVREASRSFNQMVIGLRQKKELEHFVPEGTRQEIEELQGESIQLGGVRCQRTIMFSDIRGFTSMSERLPPTRVMEVLNKYLHEMSKAVRLHGGDINEYIGDAILAVFESPDQAAYAALAMNKALAKLHRDNSLAELKELGQGIGLHTGPLVEGNIGEANARLKRAVVGDTVNLAARIQDRSRDGKYSCIFLSGATRELLTHEFDMELFGQEMFKGKSEPIEVWELKG